MTQVKISYIDVLTPMGEGPETFFRELAKGGSAISKNTRFDCGSFRSDLAALVPGISRNGKTCLEQMFERLIPKSAGRIPEGARLIFAATVGEIENLENSILNGRPAGRNSTLLHTASRLRSWFGLKKHPYVVSAACASASAAIERAKNLIQSGVEDSVLVASADCVSEFVFSGFSALMALDRRGARPFDANRDGLTAGEAAGIVLLSGQSGDGFHISGAGFSNDANHMTGPSRDGSGLARAVRSALNDAGLEPAAIGFIAAHGTGTRYNDAMELKAYKSVFPDPRPLFSVKGAVGHTMGNAGLLQLVAAVQSMKNGIIPPSAGVSEPDRDAAGWVVPESLKTDADHALVVNAGFGGINSALVVTRGKCVHDLC